MTAAMDLEADRLRALRELLPATGAGIYLDAATRGPLPAETAAAMRDAEDWELRVGRATEGRPDEVEQRLVEARSVLAALLSADPDQIVITHGASDAVARLVAVLPGRRISVLDHGDPNTGALNDPSEQRAVGDLRVLDATLTAGAIPIAADALGVDAVVFSADRWLLCPETTGALWLGPYLGSIAQPEIGRTVLLGTARSVGWLEMYVGLPWALERGQRLARDLRAALSNTPGVEVLTPERMATIVCFRLAGWSVEETLDALRRRVFAVIGSSPDGGAVRASVGWFNTAEELERFAAAVGELARHTPDTLPRRPPLVVT